MVTTKTYGQFPIRDTLLDADIFPLQGTDGITYHATASQLATKIAALIGLSLNDLSDVTIGTAAAGEILIYNATATAMENQAISGDAGLGSTGVLTITSNAITTSKILDDNVTYGKIQNVVANNVFLGNNSGAGGIVEELTATETTAILNTFTSALQGLVPASGGGTTNFLRADGTFAVPASESQTPWTSNIDGAGFNLSGVDDLTITGNIDLEGVIVVGDASSIDLSSTALFDRDFTATITGHQIFSRGIITAASNLNVLHNRFTPSGTVTVVGTHNNIASVFIDEPVIDNSAGATITTATTLLIGGAPTEATNNYAIFVDAGDVRIDENLVIGTTSPDSTALLTMSSTTLGFLPPRMTTTQRDAISSPATGLEIYNTTTNLYNFYNGTAWTVFAAGGSGDMILADVQTNIGVKTFNDTTLLLRNVANTFSLTLTNTVTSAQTLTFPDATDTMVGKATTDTLINKSIDLTNNTLTGTVAEFDTAVTDDNFVYEGAENTWGTNNQNISATGEWQEGGVAISPIGLHDIWIPSSAMWASTTSGATGLTQRELVTNDIDIQTWDFTSTTTDEYTQFIWTIPKEWNAGTITAEFFWTATGGAAGNVVWGIQAVAFANDNPMDVAWGTIQEVTDAWIANDDLHISSATSAMTIAGTPVAGEQVHFRVVRSGSDVLDTFATTAGLLGIRINYTTDSAQG